MRTKLRLPVLAATAVVSLGCAATAHAQDITLNFWAGLNEGHEAAIFDSLIEEFEASHPGVRINITPWAQRDVMTTQLRASIAAGSGPDVAGFDVGDAYIGALVRAGLVYDLSETYAERGWDQRLFPWAIDTVTYFDSQWAVPERQEAQGLWYNAALFRDNGWEPPVTWESFVAAAEAAKEAGLIPYAHGTATQGIASQTISNIVYGLIPADIVTDASTLDGTTTWADDPRFLETVQTFVDWIDNGWLPADMNSITLDDMAALFIQGRAAMTDMGPWMAAVAAEAWEDGVFEPAFVPMPAQDTSFQLTNQGAPSSALFVSAHIAPEKIDAALDFIDFMSVRSETQMRWLTEYGIIPVTYEDVSSEDLSDPVYLSVWEAHAELGEQGGVSGQWLDHFVDPEVSEVFDVGVQRLAAGLLTAEQFIDELASATEAARAGR